MLMEDKHIRELEGIALEMEGNIDSLVTLSEEVNKWLLNLPESVIDDGLVGKFEKSEILKRVGRKLTELHDILY